MREVIGWMVLGCLFLCIVGHLVEVVAYRRWLKFGEKLRTMTPEQREQAIREWNGE